MTGSEGIRKAADYLIDQLVAIGAEPLPGSDGFRLPFQYTADIEDTGTTLAGEWRDGGGVGRTGRPGALVFRERVGFGSAGLCRLRTVGA